MLQIKNNELLVSVVDPVDERHLMGSRYCTGGYIFQVTDTNVGDLLAGPTFPDSFNPFDGQGIPDSFSRAPLRHPDDPAQGLVIGVGTCDLARNTVSSWCEWDVHLSQYSASLKTHQAGGPFELTLERSVTLVERTVRSRIRLRNEGAVGFPLVWFPHPFFPQPEGNTLCRMNIDVEVRQNDGYSLREDGSIIRKNWPWDTDYYLALDHDARERAVIIQQHPLVGSVVGLTTYVPRFFPIWGNPHTFSWEPYFENAIAPGQELTWGLDYVF